MFQINQLQDNEQISDMNIIYGGGNQKCKNAKMNYMSVENGVNQLN